MHFNTSLNGATRTDWRCRWPQNQVHLPPEHSERETSQVAPERTSRACLSKFEECSRIEPSCHKSSLQRLQIKLQGARLEAMLVEVALRRLQAHHDVISLGPAVGQVQWMQVV